jgi:hypothetical protein
MKRFSALLIVWLCLSAGAVAQVLQLTPEQPVTVRFDNVRLLEKGTPPASFPGVAAQAEFLLNATGTILTIKLQNISAASAQAVLYALDLGLPLRLVNRNKLEAQFREFPAGVSWIGPTDNAAPTAGLGFCTFAARAAALQRFDDFLSTTTTLPASFLQTDQRGLISLKLTYSPGGREPVFTIEPRLYFLAPDTKTPQTKRVRLVVTRPPVR